MISGLETYAITKATEFKRYKVENSINPRYEIVEYDLPLIKEVYREIKFIIATQGYKMDDTQAMLNEANILYTTRNGVRAFGVFNGENFEVDLSRKCHSHKMELQRQTAARNGDISLSFRHSISLLYPCVTPPSVVAPVVKNTPCPLPETISRLGRGAFFMYMTACIVTLRAGFSKSFLRCPRLRNWETVNNVYSLSTPPAPARSAPSVPPAAGRPPG